MKKRINLLLSFLILSSSVLYAAPKIATVNVGEALSSYQLNKDDIKIYEAAKAKLMENPRKKALDEMAIKIKGLRAKLAETREGTDEHARNIQEGKATAAAINDLQNKWNQFSTAENRALTEALVDATNKRNNEILKIARKIGEAEGFDWILETNGRTNSKMPVVLYIRNSTDITAQVIEELDKDAPAEEEKNSAQPE